MERIDSVLDAIAALVIRASESWLGVVTLTLPIWLFAAVKIRQILRRRRAFQDFAAERNLQFTGTIPSDARPPYSRIYHVSVAVLLTNLLEGQWEARSIRVFDMPTRGGARVTTVLVTVEGTLRRGPHAERTIAAGPEARIDMDLDILCLTPLRRLDVSELPAWLSYAVALANAMERDAKEHDAAHQMIDPALAERHERCLGTHDGLHQ
jgi:hypothetical protein